MRSQPYMGRAAAGQAANGPGDRHGSDQLCGAHLTGGAASTIFRALTGQAGAAPFPPESLRETKAFKDCKA
jgi:hypothetical protein